MPNIARVLTRWFAPSSRGRAQSWVTTATLVGGALAPIVAAFLIQNVGWRWAFAIFGLLGLVWAAFFALGYWDDPARHPRVNPAELKLIRAGSGDTSEHHSPVPWSLVLAQPKLWLLGGVITCTAFLSYFFFTWYPTYLVKGRQVESTTAGWLAGLVLAGGALGSLTGGYLHDYLVRRTGSRNWPRRLLGSISLASAALWVAMSTQLDAPLATTLCLAAASFSSHVTLPCWWVTVMEASGKHVGALFGLLNAMGVPGAVASQIFLGWFTDYRHEAGYRGRDQWDPAFWVYVAVMLTGATGWLLIDPRRKFEEKTH